MCHAIEFQPFCVLKPFALDPNSPASLHISMNIIVAPGSRSDGFISITFPVTSAIGNIHNGIIAGKLKGVIPEKGEDEVS